MSRAVVFKTKGKLDLRSLTVFGMNAKPTTTTPIGYFGTGLKYAVAVLARKFIPITFWIDGKKWTVEQDETKFRDKEFRALTLKRHSMIPKTINLPFTTELGKNWELWQAFRELESNTRDEHGETFIDDTGQLDNPEHPIGDRGLTYIVVESEDFVQEYLSRDGTFLPDGLTERNSSERVQCFLQKSNYIYYRGIRIMDLKEPSENTYNILSQITLTEDRTAKNKFDVDWEIEKFVAESKDEALIQRAVTAPAKTYERTLGYTYASRGETFQSVVGKNLDQVSPGTKEQWQVDNPPPKKILPEDWREALIECINHNDDIEVLNLVRKNRDELRGILEQHIEDNPYESDAQHAVGTDQPIIPKETSHERPTINDDIPF